MDQALLRELAQFKMLFRRTTSQAVDIEKLITDKVYGKEILTAAENTDEEALVIMALDLKDKLGLLPQPTPHEEPKPADAASDAKPKDKYVFGTRG